MVEQGDDVSPELRHRVRRHVVRLIGGAVSEHVDGDDAVAALGQHRHELGKHSPVHQQAVGEDDRARPVAKHAVRDAAPLVAEAVNRWRR